MRKTAQLLTLALLFSAAAFAQGRGGHGPELEVQEEIGSIFWPQSSA